MTGAWETGNSNLYQPVPTKRYARPNRLPIEHIPYLTLYYVRGSSLHRFGLRRMMPLSQFSTIR